MSKTVAFVGSTLGHSPRAVIDMSDEQFFDLCRLTATCASAHEPRTW
jgi:hypothetical protein